jgi:hypothetical protein
MFFQVLQNFFHRFITRKSKGGVSSSFFALIYQFVLFKIIGVAFCLSLMQTACQFLLSSLLQAILLREVAACAHIASDAGVKAGMNHFIIVG